MGIKRYILAALVYLLAVGLYVYSFNGDAFTLEIYKYSLQFPIALWVILPAIILFVVSLLHMMFYNFRIFLDKRTLKKDFETFKSALGSQILAEDTHLNYRTEEFKFVGKALGAFAYQAWPEDLVLEDDRIKAAVKVVKDLDDGEVVELKKYKLSAKNKLRIQNKFNMLEKDPKNALNILKECEEPSSALCQKAYFDYIAYANYDDIKKIQFPQNKEIFRVLMERYLDENDSFTMDLDSITNLLTQFRADPQDYLELAREIKIKLDPDSMLKLFEKLYNSTEHVAADAYLYVLYELQMIDKMRDILDNSEENEFIKFKTLLFLRDHGKNVNSELFLRV